MSIQLNVHQRNNWAKVIAFMLESADQYDYQHDTFASADDDSDTAFCILSFVLRTSGWNVYDVPTDLDFYDYNNEWNTVLTEAFGSEDFYSNFSSGASDFANYLSENDVDTESVETIQTVVKYLRAFLGINDSNIKYLTVLWKNNTKDRFSTEAALKEFFELNPHRTRAVRKITVTKNVQRVVYDEVEEGYSL